MSQFTKEVRAAAKAAAAAFIETEAHTEADLKVLQTEGNTQIIKRYDGADLEDFRCADNFLFPVTIMGRVSQAGDVNIPIPPVVVPGFEPAADTLVTHVHLTCSEFLALLPHLQANWTVPCYLKAGDAKNPKGTLRPSTQTRVMSWQEAAELAQQRAEERKEKRAVSAPVSDFRRSTRRR